jgi:radical SAM superfamily enzyme YgiQ (UPF0313 family)
MPDLSKEIRRFPTSDPGPEPLHIGIVYPNTYPVAISSLGYQTVHLTAASHPGMVTHRIVLDKADGRDYPNRTLEEGLEIKSLDALLISCSFELDYPHIVRILDESGIPVLQKHRQALPLVIIGGIAPTANPEPLALIADAIAIGEAEIILSGILDDLLDTYPLLQGPRFLEGRDRIYEMWNRRDGVYVPGREPDRQGGVVQASIANPDEFPSYTPIISPDGVYGARNLVSVSSGCPARCRFCLLSFVLPPGPDRSMESVLENARIFSPDEASVGLVSSRISDHPAIVEIINSLANDGYNVSVSSLRVASTSAEMLQALARSGAKSVTFAPEHGSARIRDVICKPYTYEEVRERVEWAYEAGMSRVKLYFLTGFEEETPEDIAQTPEFILSLADDIGLATRPADNRLSIGIAPFVPKASTPFQRRPMQDEKTLKRKIQAITAALERMPRIEVEIESPRSSIMQGALSIADRTGGLYLAEMSKSRGPLIASWENVLRELGDSPKAKVLGHRDHDPLPWNFIIRPHVGGK